MTGMNLYEALTDIEDQYILDASESVRKQRNQTWVKRLMIAAAAVIILLAAGAVLNGQLRKADKGNTGMLYGTEKPVDNGTQSGKKEEKPTKRKKPDENIDEVMDYLIEQGEITKWISETEIRPEDVLTDKIKLVSRTFNDLCNLYRKSGGTVQSWVSGVWEYKVPVEKDGTYYILSILKKEDGLECVEATVNVAADSPMLEKYLIGDEEIDKILTHNGFRRQDVLTGEWMYSYMYRTLFYVFTIDFTEQNERVIPFSDLWIGDRSDSVNLLDSGRVYKPEEIVEALETLGREQRTDAEILYGGGGPIGEDISSKTGNRSANDPLWAILLAVGIVVYVVVTGVIVRSGNSRDKRKA